MNFRTSNIFPLIELARLMLRFTSACTISALAGCAVGPNFHRPQPPAVGEYTRQAAKPQDGQTQSTGKAQKIVFGEEPERRWWTLFGSMALNNLVDQAFQHSPTIESAQSALQQAKANTAAQFGTYFPVLQGGYSGSRQRNAVGTISPTLTSGDPVFNLHTAQLSIGYLPDVFGGNRRAVESLAAQEEIQRYQLDAAYLTLASNVTAAVIQEAALKAQIDAAEKIIDGNEKSLEILRRQFNLGFASGLDVATVESSYAQARAALPPLMKQLEQTRDLLAVLTGRFPSQRTPNEFELSAFKLPRELPLSIPSQLVNKRPDVRAAEAQLHSASALVGVAISNRLPQFNIAGAYGGTSTQIALMFAEGNKFWAITGSVVQTIFDFGTLKSRQRAAEAALDQAGAQYRQVVLLAFQNVADVLYAIESDANSLVAAEASEFAARKTLDLTRQQLDLGAVNGLALFSAQAAYQQAVIGLIQARANQYTDSVALFQALGWSTQLPTPK